MVGNILIYRVGFLGDIVCALPAMVAVRKRFPDAKIVLLTNKEKRGRPDPEAVLSGNDFLDEIITYETEKIRDIKYLWNLVWNLRSFKFDLVVYLSLFKGTKERLVRDWLFFSFARCRRKVGFKLAIPDGDYSVSEGVSFPKYPKEVERLMALLRPLGIDQTDVEFRLPLLRDDIAFVDRIWREHNLFFVRPLVAISPGGKFQTQRWFWERYAKTAHELIERYGAKIILIGGPGDREEGNQIARFTGSRVINLIGKLNYMQSGEAIRRCSLLVSNDSGPVHLAAAVGTPVVGIYSARNHPETWHPWGDIHTILRNDLISCRFCRLTECETRECLKGISVSQVIEACRFHLVDIKT
ncbi:MAG: hypothetical protein GTN76_09930 [Candidatus Aenigmarchaeota archaeon]|nr:hypothetical protein [Candidatus Aenigmarchaeota archaeon]